jgi:group II intron reverse transcriptase/maturase
MDKKERFTALLHHVDVDRLREAYRALNPRAATGVDDLTWEDYGRDLEENLRDLHARVQRGSYRARPTRRAYIPKPDGRMRPLGIAALEDKILQRAVVEVLNGIYEADFLGFSYGFRPGRSPHDALDALAFGIDRKKVSWALDADIRDFFGQLDHDWLLRFLEHRIADRRVLRLIQKWLVAGVIENGEWSKTQSGTAQGASASPLLANVYLHYVFDLWADQWRGRHARGEMIIVRYADDYLVGFERERDARQFLADLRQRLADFSLELAPDKTRLIEFGRFAARDRARRGLGKPETFDFLGFTHCCARTKNGRFMLSGSRSPNECGPSCARSRTSSNGADTTRSPTRAGGWAVSCAGTTPTTPCPATATGSTASTTKSHATGSNRSGDAANARDWPGRG